MSIRHTSQAAHHPPKIIQDPQMTQDLHGKVLLLRRRKDCKSCGRVHGPPLERCEAEETKSKAALAPDDLHLPWIF